MPSWQWQEHAACRGKSLVLFFGRDGERPAEREARERIARSVCARCPVRSECLDYALTRPEKYGTWGGLSEDERATERRRRMRLAASGADLAEMDYKRCNTCKRLLPPADFYRDSRTGDGLSSQCVTCRREAARKRAQQAASA